MRITARGWNRDHGENRICDTNLKLSKTFDGHYYRNRSTISGFGFVNTNFHSNITLNGDYLFEVSFSNDDLFRLLEVGTRDMSLGEVIDKLSALRNRANFDPLWDLKIGDLELTAATVGALEDSDINFVGDIIKLQVNEVLELPNVGPRRLSEIQQALRKHNLRFNVDTSIWERPDLDDDEEYELF
jgi:hypothetical protein